MAEFSHDHSNQAPRPEMEANPYRVLLDESQGAVLSELDTYVDRATPRLTASTDAVRYEHVRHWRTDDQQLTVSHSIVTDMTTVSRVSRDGKYDVVEFTRDPQFGWTGAIVDSSDLKTGKGPKVEGTVWNDEDGVVGWGYVEDGHMTLRDTDLIRIVNDSTAPGELRETALGLASEYTKGKVDNLIALLDGTYRPRQRVAAVARRAAQTALHPVSSHRR